MPKGMSPIKPSTPIKNQCPRYVSNQTLTPTYKQCPTDCIQSNPSLRSITNAHGMSPIKPSTPIYNQLSHGMSPIKYFTPIYNQCPRYVSNQNLHSDL